MRKAVRAAFSSVETSLCRSEAGEKEKENARQYGKGKAPVFYFFPSSPARLLFFNYCYFLLGYPNGSLWGGVSGAVERK